MRKLAAPLIALVIGSQTAGAQTVRPSDRDLRIAACRAWHDQLKTIVRRNSDHGLLPADDAAAVYGLIEIIGQRCAGDDAGRMSQLYAILLDTLVDQENQP